VIITCANIKMENEASKRHLRKVENCLSRKCTIINNPFVYICTCGNLKKIKNFQFLSLHSHNFNFSHNKLTIMSIIYNMCKSLCLLLLLIFIRMINN